LQCIDYNEDFFPLRPNVACWVMLPSLLPRPLGKGGPTADTLVAAK